MSKDKNLIEKTPDIIGFITTDDIKRKEAKALKRKIARVKLNHCHHRLMFPFLTIEK